MSVAGEAANTPSPAGEAGRGAVNPAGDAGQKPPQSGTTIPQEFMPLVDARVKADLDNVRAAERARVLQEMKAEAERNQMTETQKLATDLQNAKTSQTAAERERDAVRRERDVTLAALDLGRVPSEYLTAAISRAGEADTPQAIAKAAHDKFTADLKTYGGSPGPKPSAVPPGGAPAGGDGGITSMSEMEIRMKARSDRKWYDEIGSKELARRFNVRQGITG